MNRLNGLPKVVYCFGFCADGCLFLIRSVVWKLLLRFDCCDVNSRLLERDGITVFVSVAAVVAVVAAVAVVVDDKCSSAGCSFCWTSKSLC